MNKQIQSNLTTKLFQNTFNTQDYKLIYDDMIVDSNGLKADINEDGYYDIWIDHDHLKGFLIDIISENLPNYFLTKEEKDYICFLLMLSEFTDEQLGTWKQELENYKNRNNA